MSSIFSQAQNFDDHVTTAQLQFLSILGRSKNIYDILWYNVNGPIFWANSRFCTKMSNLGLETWQFCQDEEIWVKSDFHGEYFVSKPIMTFHINRLQLLEIKACTL